MREEWDLALTILLFLVYIVCSFQQVSDTGTDIEAETTLLLLKEEKSQLPGTGEQVTGPSQQQIHSFPVWLLTMAAHIVAILFCAYIIYVAAPGSGWYI